MGRFKIGVMSDSFRLAPRDGIRKAKEVGADGIQIYAVAGEICPEVMDRSTRADFRRFCADLGLQIAALCGDLGGHGFERVDENPAKVERSKRIVDLAVDLGAPVVTTHIGVVPADQAHPRYAIMQAACHELGEYARHAGVAFAIETGPETAAVLKMFLDDVGSKGIGVNLDPANFVMVTGQDPVAAVHILKDYIVHTHAKDGVQLQPCDPERVYEAFAEGGIAGLTMGDIARLFREVPLGQGSVPWEAYLDALSAVGYSGFLTIEREVGENPEQDIRQAVQFLRARI
ncbi:MAG: sugar phosphate isomerase/epimerase [Anaerolineae bacterium]|nr:sugar phosphate isomerase/epimerase [Thermoflexales bacterium]MDW8407963.1 sugar phosphate isomerase/epimerase [Anaerolineae bacterium]